MSSDAWKLETPELLQQIALLAFLGKQGGEGQKFLELTTKARVFAEVYNRLSKQREIDEARSAVIFAICDYIKKNPRASQQEQAKVIKRHIEQFAATVEAL